jgi:hypothetical protein
MQSDRVDQDVARDNRSRRSSIHCAHRSLHAIALALQSGRWVIQPAGLPNQDVASSSPRCMIISSRQPIPAQGLPGRRCTVSPELIKWPPRVHTLLLPLISRVLRLVTHVPRLNGWSPCEYGIDRSAQVPCALPRPRRRLATMHATDAVHASTARTKQSPAWNASRSRAVLLGKSSRRRKCSHRTHRGRHRYRGLDAELTHFAEFSRYRDLAHVSISRLVATYLIGATERGVRGAVARIRRLLAWIASGARFLLPFTAWPTPGEQELFRSLSPRRA